MGVDPEQVLVEDGVAAEGRVEDPDAEDQRSTTTSSSVMPMIGVARIWIQAVE